MAVEPPPAAVVPPRLAASDQAWIAALTARPVSDFAARLRAAADALPAVGEGREGVSVAAAQTAQARSRLFPVLGIDINAADSLARDFRLPSTRFESLVPRQRTDAVGSISQLLLDWGATSARIRAGQAAEAGAAANADLARTDALVALIGVWHEAIAARAALTLTQAHAGRLAQLAALVEARTAAGAESAAEAARAAAAAAQGEARLADAVRRDVAAHARLAELWGDGIGEPARALPPPDDRSTRELPDVRAARAEAEARRLAARAAKADRLPRLDARLTGSAFDIASGYRPDYDVRGTLGLSARFSTGSGEAARVAELAATARRAEFAAERISAQTERERAEAEADLAARAAALPAQRRALDTALTARTLFGARFQAARGTLFDLLTAEREALDSGLALVDAEIRLDLARWVVLARRGTLLDVVDGGGARP